MTKPRAPVSIENTLYQVLGELGIERAAEVTNRGEGYLRSMSDPDRREQLTVRDLLSLDLAYFQAGNATFPLYETLGLLLKAEGAGRFAATAAIGHHAAEVARESGEATAALIDAALAGNDPTKLRDALREAEQSRDATTAAIVTLRSHLTEKPP